MAMMHFRTRGGSWIPAVKAALELDNGVLTVRGERQVVREESSEDRRGHPWERRYGSFHQTFSLCRAP